MGNRRGSWMVLLLVIGLGSGAGRGQQPGVLPPSMLIPQETAEPPLADAPATPKPAPAAGGDIQQTGFNVAQNDAGPPYQPLPTGRPVELPKTPVVTLHVHAPANAAAGQELEYRLEIVNPSRAAAHHVTVLGALPKGARYVHATPEPKLREPELQWAIGTLGPGVRKEVRLTLLPGAGESIQFAARVRFEYGQVVKTRLVKPKVALRQFVPKEAVLDDLLPFKLEVTNQSPVTLTDVVVTSVLPPDAEHDDGPDATGASVARNKQRREWALGNLPPGASRVLTYKVRAKQVMTLEALATVTAAGGVKEDVSQKVDVKQVALSLTMTGPPTAYAGQPISYRIEAVNIGTAPLHNVVVTDTLPPFCEMTKLPDGSRQFGGNLQWTFPTLQPGEQKPLTVELKATAPGKFTHRAIVKTARGKNQQAECNTEILGSASLQLDVEASASSVDVGGTVQYRVTVTNTGTAAADGVTVTAELPKELQLKDAQKARQEGQRLLFDPGAIPPGQGRTLTVTTVAKEPGELHFKAEARDRQMTTGPGVSRECVTRALPSVVAPAPPTRLTAGPGPVAPGTPGNLPTTLAAPMSVVPAGPSTAPPAPPTKPPAPAPVGGGPPVLPALPINPMPMGAPAPKPPQSP